MGHVWRAQVLPCLEKRREILQVSPRKNEANDKEAAEAEAAELSEVAAQLRGVGSADEMADILEDVERLGGALAELPHQLSPSSQQDPVMPYPRCETLLSSITTLDGYSKKLSNQACLESQPAVPNIAVALWSVV